MMSGKKYNNHATKIALVTWYKEEKGIGLGLYDSDDQYSISILKPLNIHIIKTVKSVNISYKGPVW